MISVQNLYEPCVSSSTEYRLEQKRLLYLSNITQPLSKTTEKLWPTEPIERFERFETSRVVSCFQGFLIFAKSLQEKQTKVGEFLQQTCQPPDKMAWNTFKNAQLGKHSTTNIFTKYINPGITTARPFFLYRYCVKHPGYLYKWHHVSENAFNRGENLAYGWDNNHSFPFGSGFFH